MEKLEKAKKLIQELENQNYLKLKRSMGVGLYLFNLLKDHLDQAHLNMLKEFDRLSIGKRIAILKSVKEQVRKPSSVLMVNFDPYEKKLIESFFVSVENISFLKKEEKKILENLGIKDLYSALWYIPIRYEDRRINTSIRTTMPGQKVALRVKVVGKGYSPQEKYPAFVKCEDATGTLYLRFRFKDERPLYHFREGGLVVVYGRLKEFKGEKYMVHPEIITKDGEYGKILPFYYVRSKGERVNTSSKTRHRKIRNIIEKLLEETKHIPEYIPKEILEKHSFPKIGESLYMVHKPLDGNEEELNAFRLPFQKRLIYEELFLFQLALGLKRKGIQKLPAVVIKDGERHLEYFLSKLPFRLTEAQRRVVGEILKDLSSGKPMNRLLQGDVGSGKTVVAMAVAYILAKEGYQSAILAPTEILAHQHYENFKKFLGFTGTEVGLLTGSVRGSTRENIYRHVARGDIKVLIGTHALLQEELSFKSLAFVVVDEQHRFGVMQRKLLLEKGRGFYPHCLVMSATPIPRTLALSLYGDLDVSLLDQMPEGRKPIITKVFFESEAEKYINFIRNEINKGGKAYVIYPLIEESDKLELKAATAEYERWKSIFNDKKVLLMHGKLKDTEKRSIMEEFKRDGDILVSTTVVEVGVDVPLATVMLIESAHRFGLSQIHQLRGRVGRSERQGYCFLTVPDEVKNMEAEAIKRLSVLVKTNDGFKIAEEDLKLRGPGELMGISQSGYFGFTVANLAREEDRNMLHIAKEDAKNLIESSNIPTDIKKLLLYKYANRIEIISIA
ncbi:MAG: ATP-dependent DNA helicase RecG [Aquificaceae bacterium]